MKRFFLCASLLVCVVMAGCTARQEASGDAGVVVASEPGPGSQATGTAGVASNTASASSDFEDYGEEADQAISDPIEPWNRFWFSFNDFVLINMVKPVYTGYKAITPSEFRTGFSNALHNAQAPIRVANRILQGEFAMAWIELGRFLVNSTIGFGGLIDVTKGKKPLVPMDEDGADFGETLGRWGVGEGFYVVWPLIGPSTLRDSVGLAGDFTASPFFWAVEPTGNLVGFWPGVSADLFLRFNGMGQVIDTYETLVKSSVEPYVAARDAYVKYRRAHIAGPTLDW